MEGTVIIDFHPGTLSLKDRDWTDLRDRIITVISSGGLAVLPTETSYMLAGDARNRIAVARIFLLKDRPRGMPLSVAFSSLEHAAEWVEIPPAARELARRFLPGPLTLILPVRPDRPKIAAAVADTLGIRVPGHPYILDLLLRSGIPLTATSANPHGGPEPYSIQRCVTGVDLVWNAGRLSPDPPSTIVGFSGGTPTVIRPGGISRDAIWEVLSAY